MIEFWASVGLAYFNRDFYEKVIQDDPGAAGTAIGEWGIRLSRFEFTELRRVLKDPALTRCIKGSQMKAVAFACPPPPRNCPGFPDEAALKAALKKWYPEFEELFLKQIK